MPRLAIVFALVGLLAAPLVQASDADQTFKSIYQAEWAWRQGKPLPDGQTSPPPDNARLDSVDAESQKQRLDYWQTVMDKLDDLDVDALSAENQVNYKVYRRQIRVRIADQKFKQWQMPFNSDTAFWSSVGYKLGGDHLQTADDYAGYLERLDQIPHYFQQQMANMRLGLKRGFSVPRAVLDGRDKSIADVANLDDPTASDFYKPFADMPSRIDADTAKKLRHKARREIREDVIPAYGKLLTFFREEYVPNARTTLSAEDLPDGEAYYRHQIRKYTTLQMTPEAIHEKGLERVQKLDKRMHDVMKQVDFDGDFDEFVDHLRHADRFYADSKQELLDKTAWVAKEVDGAIDQVIGHLPRQRFTIVPVPADIAPYYTSGRGGADEYLVNTYDLDSRALFNMPALTLHESYPGHSLQLELARERKGHPAFRRNGYISAYGEGWGLYSEFLGNEMGIYDTPYKKFGFLNYQMWRAARLVIDTGIHAMGWSRDKAIDYLSEHTALSHLEIVNEIDRYISWPGQADSYELGYLTIRRLRDKAEDALGDDFDVRAFDDTVLSTGSVPLPVLEDRIGRFIDAGGPEPDYGQAE